MNEPPRFNLLHAATHWGLSRETLRTRLNAAGIEGKGGEFLISEINRAVFRDIDAEKLDNLAEETISKRMANAKEAGQLVDLEDFRKDQARIAIAAKQAILGLKELTEEQKFLVLTTMADLLAA